MTDYSYQEILEDGISVCVSCGGANINFNKPRPNENLDIAYCFDCNFAEGTMYCMPDDEIFYPDAQITYKKLQRETK